MAVARRRREAEMSVGELREVFLAGINRPEKTPPGSGTVAEGSAWT